MLNFINYAFAVGDRGDGADMFNRADVITEAVRGGGGLYYF